MTVNVNECELIKYKDTFLKQLKYGDDVVYELPAQTTMKKVSIPYIPEVHTSIGTPSFPIWGELGTHECLVEQILDNPYRCSTIGRISLFITNRLFRIARTSGTKCDVLTYFVLGSYDVSTDTTRTAEVYAEKLQNIDTTNIDGIPALMEYVYTTKPAWKEECKHVVGTEYGSLAYVLTEGGTTIDIYNIYNFSQVYSERYIQSITSEASFGVKDYKLWFLEREDIDHAQLNASKRRICNSHSGIWLMPYKAAVIMDNDSATCANTAPAFNTYANSTVPQFHTVFANYRVAPAVWYIEGTMIMHSTPIPAYYHKSYVNPADTSVRVSMNQGLLLNVPRQEYIDWCNSYSSIFSDLRVAYLNKYGADFKYAFVMLLGSNASPQPNIVAHMFSDAKLPPRWDSPADISRAVANGDYPDIKTVINSHTSTDELTFNGTTWTWHSFILFALWIRYMYCLHRCAHFVDEVTEKVVENGKNVYYTMYPLTIARDLYEGSDTVDIRVLMHCATRGARSIYPSALEDNTADTNYLYRGFLGTHAKFGSSINNSGWDMSLFNPIHLGTDQGKSSVNWNVKHYESVWRSRYENTLAYWDGYGTLYTKAMTNTQNVQYPPLMYSNMYGSTDAANRFAHTLFSYVRPSSTTLHFETDTYRNKWYIPRVFDTVAITAGVHLDDKNGNILNAPYKYPNLFVSTNNVRGTAAVSIKTHMKLYNDSVIATSYTNEFDYYKSITQGEGVQASFSVLPFDNARSGLLTLYNRTSTLDPTKSALVHIYKHELEAVGAYDDLIDETVETLMSYINVPSSTSLVSSALLTEGLGTWYDRDETVGYNVISVDPDDSRFNMVIVSTGGNNVQD